MEHTLPARTPKPDDIHERLLLFACDVVRVAQDLHRRGPIASALSLQLVEAAVNAASNLEEGDDGIALREIKETRIRLQILRATGHLTGRDDRLISESLELVKIVATMIRNSAANEAVQSSERQRHG
jgi:hypothetical protein